MARSINKVILLGRLGKDPEMKYLENGTAVTSFSLATNHYRPGADGTAQEATEWHQLTAWGKVAEIANEYLRKGSLVYVEGSLRTRSWEDTQTSQKRYKTEIIVHEVVFLDKATGSGGSAAPIEAGATEQDELTR